MDMPRERLPEGWRLVVEGKPAEIRDYLLAHPELTDRTIQIREKKEEETE